MASASHSKEQRRVTSKHRNSPTDNKLVGLKPPLHTKPPTEMLLVTIGLLIPASALAASAEEQYTPEDGFQPYLLLQYPEHSGTSLRWNVCRAGCCPFGSSRASLLTRGVHHSGTQISCFVDAL